MPSSNIFKNATLIHVRLTRDNDADNDDRIVIKYKDEDSYQIYFQDGNTTSFRPSTYCTVLSGEELDVYIESLFTLLVRDKAPFESIQFQLPCFPCLRYDIQDLREGKLRATLKRIMPILYAAARM
jgi:hypothetical protein